jgi:hypothetical protein
MKKANLEFRLITVIFLISILSSCISSRNITNSGKVTPQGQLKIGGNMVGNIPTQTAGAITNSVKDLIVDYVKEDTIYTDQAFDNATKSIMAYALDPLNGGFDFYLRYGLVKQLDIGYKYASGSHVFDLQFQFTGPTGTVKNPEEGENFYGSIGIQFATQNLDLPSYLTKMVEITGFKFKRKELLIPLIFSQSFGQEEKYGCFSFGLVYSHTFINYGFIPDNQYKFDKIINVFDEVRRNYSTYGGFFNIKAGYEYAYVIFALAAYYQNYGDYRLLSGIHTSLKGLTFVPSIGLQFKFGKKEKNSVR